MGKHLIDVAGLRAADDPLVFDCRHRLDDPGWGRRAFAEGHLPGARHLHLDEELSGRIEPGPNGPRGGRHPLPDPETFGALMRRHGLRAGRLVVALDDAGNPFAARLWWLLRWLGHDAVRVLDGGLAAWTAAGGELVAGDAGEVAPGDWRPRPDPARIAEHARVAAIAAGAGAGATVVDVRDPARYRGEHEPIDPVGGHIPGAINRPWKELLDESGRLARAPAVPGGPLVFSCGSGVTACVGLLALAEHAGREDALLYPGSWSGWLAEGGGVESGPPRQ